MLDPRTKIISIISKQHSGDIYKIRLNVQSNLISTAGADKKVKIMDIRKNEAIHTFNHS